MKVRSTKIVIAGFALFLIFFAVLVFSYITLRASLPTLTGEKQLQGLESIVSVSFDRFGIPTITAKSRLDAVRALGFVTAQERLFQMDLMRRAAFPCTWLVRYTAR